MSTRLEQLRKKQDQVKAQIQQVLAAEKAAEKKRKTRRRFLLGDAVITQVMSGELADFDLYAVMDRFLVQPDDRALFRLEPLPIDRVDSETADQESGDIEADADTQKNMFVAEPSDLPSISSTAKTRARAKKG